MSHDIVDLHNFYQSSLGKTVKKIISQLIAKSWPQLDHLKLLSVGYPLPYLNAYVDKAERTLVFMPSQQGVIPWPEGQPCLTSLVDEDCLPLADESIDRILLIHSLEHTNQVRPFLREIWRILSGHGKVLIIVPNRRGIWARLDSTPFGHGNPYTMTQLSHLLRENQFTPLCTYRGLYTFPSQSLFILSLTPLWEALGKRVLQKFSGLVCIECTKQVYAAYPSRQKKTSSIPSLAGVRSQRI